MNFTVRLLTKATLSRYLALLRSKKEALNWHTARAHGEAFSILARTIEPPPAPDQSSRNTPAHTHLTGAPAFTQRTVGDSLRLPLGAISSTSVNARVGQVAIKFIFFC